MTLQPTTPRASRYTDLPCPYAECIAVDKCFSRYQDWERHVDQVHGPKERYRCPYVDCKHHTKRSYVLENHLKEKHGWVESDAKITVGSMKANPAATDARVVPEDQNSALLDASSSNLQFHAAQMHPPSIPINYSEVYGIAPQLTSTSYPSLQALHPIQFSDSTMITPNANDTTSVITPQPTSQNDFTREDATSYREHLSTQSYTDLLNSDDISHEGPSRFGC